VRSASSTLLKILPAAGGSRCGKWETDLAGRVPGVNALAKDPGGRPSAFIDQLGVKKGDRRNVPLSPSGAVPARPHGFIGPYRKYI